MRPELDRCYRLLRSEWPGKAVQLNALNHRGTPDFLLIHKQFYAICEVKPAQGSGSIIDIKAIQVQTLNGYHRQGILCGVLVLLDESHWIWMPAPLKMPLRAQQGLPVFLGDGFLPCSPLRDTS